MKASRIYFWDEFAQIQSVEIVETRVEDPNDEFFDASNIRNTSLKEYRKYISNFQNIWKKVRPSKVTLAAQKIKIRLEKLQKLFKPMVNSKAKSAKLEYDLKDSYPHLGQSIMVSKKHFDELHKGFCKKLKYALRLRSSAKTYSERFDSVSNMNELLKNRKQIVKDLKKFNDRPTLAFDLIEEQNQKIEQLSRVSEFLQKVEIKNKPLRELFKDFEKSNPSNAVSFECFRKHTKYLKLRYTMAKRFTRNDEAEKVRRINFMIDLIDHHSNKKEELLFFDVTSINEKAFKPKAWSTKLKPTGFKPLFQFQATHLLMIVSLKQVIAFQFTKGNLSSLIIFNFLFNAILRLKERHGQKPLKIILDNSTMHHTVIMKNLFLLEKVKAVYPPPHNPFFNMIEFVFRYVKSGLKHELTLR